MASKNLLNEKSSFRRIVLMVLQLTNEVRKAPTELCYSSEHVAPKLSMKMEHLQKLHIVKSYGDYRRDPSL